MSNRQPDLNSTTSTIAIAPPFLRLRRYLFFALVALSSLTGISLMIDILSTNGINLLELLVLVLFAATFSWITIPFWNSIIGFTLIMLNRDPLSLKRIATDGNEGPIKGMTALVVPIRNEDTERLMRGLTAVLKSLASTRHRSAFDLHLLSDTTDPIHVLREKSVCAQLHQMAEIPTNIYYRQRTKNTGRKAGNIADFCDEWGQKYDFMVVLDADSVMTGPALIKLVRAMEANPTIGIIQTVPLPAFSDTLFGRIVQFASCLYSPLLATGQSFWQTDVANYWGHNAILRMRPFIEHCKLPILSGTPPFGGSILSHDFVEAALIRRAGWKTYLLTTINGSYEEIPSNILEYAKRDRRWTQGSLQHLRLLCMPYLHPLSRSHFVGGAMGYFASLLWLLILMVSTAYIIVSSPTNLFSAEPYLVLQLSPNHFFRPSHVIPLLTLTILLLFFPKILGVMLALTNKRQAFGGHGRLIVSAVLEAIFAILIAPVMMMYHTRFILGVFSGKDVIWEASIRKARRISWLEAWKSVRSITVFGLIWAALTLYCSPTFFLWMTPIFTGLIFAVPLICWSSSRSIGQFSHRCGIFLVPSETRPTI